MESDTNENGIAESEDEQLSPHQKYTKEYVEILKAYKIQYQKSATDKNDLKREFFAVIKSLMYWMIAVFVIAVIGSFTIMRIMIKYRYSSIELLISTIVPIVGSFATMAISILKLPKIIARYLFNKKEDELMKDIIQNIQTYEIGATKYEKMREQLGVEVATNRLGQEGTDVEFEEPPSLQNGFPESEKIVQDDNGQAPQDAS